MTASSPNSRDAFETHVGEWLRLSSSVSGRMRTKEILHHLRGELGGSRGRLLDAGGGSGEIAVGLAGDGHSIILMDFSPAMLFEARIRCRGLRVNCLCADIAQSGNLFPPESFDGVLCHSVLEFVENPAATLDQLARLLRKGGILSVLVGNRYHEPIRWALLEQEFASARQALEAELPAVDLFGLPRRTFYPRAVRNTLTSLGLQVTGEYGIRLFSGLLTRATGNMEELLALELAAGARMPYRHMARFLLFIARKV